ncbi:hypothetical protein D9M71_684650 [compost metagenome]
MQADTEHQQHHADFGQLVGQRLVGDEAGSERSYADARNQVTDQRRQTQLVGQRAENEGEPKANGDDVDQVGVMVHRGSQLGGCPDFHRCGPIRQTARCRAPLGLPAEAGGDQTFLRC